VTYPNADTSGRLIMERLEEFAARHPGRCRLVRNLGERRYLSLLRHADVMVGNSSSGLIEAPSFGLPAVNVGARQRGRLRGANVIGVEPARDEILAGIETAQTPAFRARAREGGNPYGDGPRRAPHRGDLEDGSPRRAPRPEALRRRRGRPLMADLAGCTLALGASLLAVLETMTRSGKQIALVVDADGRLAGVVTDGDVRRAMLRGASLDAKVDEVVNRAPLTGPPASPPRKRSSSCGRDRCGICRSSMRSAG
jgi:UDP-N-acetylglucosamine 2-epimerase